MNLVYDPHENEERDVYYRDGSYCGGKFNDV